MKDQRSFDIMSIFRDVRNEWYLADTSRKIKTVFKAGMESLTAPYSEERRRAASKAAKMNPSNLSRRVHNDVL